MTKDAFWKKWGQPYPGMETHNPETKSEFMDDLNGIIERNQAPFSCALQNIMFEIESLMKGEVNDAEAQAKRLK